MTEQRDSERYEGSADKTAQFGGEVQTMDWSRMHWLVGWLIVLSLSVHLSKGKQETDGKCIRYLDSHYIVNRVRNFHHIDHMARLVTKLREERVITEMTYTIVMQRITQSIHGNCVLKTRLRKRKRQAI